MRTIPMLLVSALLFASPALVQSASACPGHSCKGKKCKMNKKSTSHKESSKDAKPAEKTADKT